MQGLCLKYAKAAPAASGEASQPRFAVGLHAGVTPYPLNCQYERIDELCGRLGDEIDQAAW